MFIKDYQKTFWGRIPFSIYKYLELEINIEDEFYSYFNFTINWTRKVDHQGIYISFELFKFNLLFRIYDTRHWDYERGDYESDTIS